MGIYIDGMKMPKEGFVEILIRDDGTVQQTGQSYRIDGTDYYTPYVGEMPKMFTAVPVPPHGRLIDADALAEEHRELAYELRGENYDFHMTARSWVNSAPTVIEAEEVYGQYTDTAGNFHWCGTHSGEHTVKAKEEET